MYNVFDYESDLQIYLIMNIFMWMAGILRSIVRYDGIYSDLAVTGKSNIKLTWRI